MRWLVVLVMAAGMAGAGLADKLALSGGFPRFYCFRGEMPRASNSDYDAWRSFLDPSYGVIRKFLTEELAIPADRAQWATRYAAEQPRQLLMLHFNGEACATHAYPEVRARFFPGHWVTTGASTVTDAVAADGETLTVNDIAPFRPRGYLDRDRQEWYPLDLLLVDLDDQGRRDWSTAEYVVVRSVDAAKRSVTVARGQYSTKALPRRAGRAHLAPLVGAIWGRQVQWHYNLSSRCPRDPAGHSAADNLATQLRDAFAPAGPLHAFDGIAFDVNYWQARSPEWDTDADGRADGGIVGGHNVWREGDADFLRQVRAAVGEDRLLSCDSQVETNQTALGTLDGIESEGLVIHNDGWRGLSRTLNIHDYWQTYNPRPHDFRYIVLKLMDTDDAQRAEPLRRLGVAVACCLGAGVTRAEMGEHRAAPELTRGDDQQLGWLGQPAGPLLRPVLAAPDLLAGVDVVKRLRGEDCTIAADAAGIQVAGTGATPLTPCRLTLPGIAAPAGDLTVAVTLRMIDPADGFDAASPVPRLVRASLDPLPDYGEGPRRQQMHARLFGLAGTRGDSRLTFTWRKLPGGPVTLSLEVAERGRFRLAGITAHSGPDLLARRFQHGLALANPTLSPATFDLVKLFGAERRWRRLRCAWLPGYDGQPVTDARAVVVPACDGLLLAEDR